MRLLIAGGGTGGHVLPALAVVEELRRRNQLEAVLWVGSEDGLEREAAARAEIPYQGIQTGKLRRYLSLQTAVDAVRVPIGIVQARRVLDRFRPTIVLSTGGFVSVPTVIAAAAHRRAPILTHEQTAVLGLATRINARFVDTLAVSYDRTAVQVSRLHCQVIVTGNPVRAFLASGDAARGRTRWGFAPDLPLLYVTGGARGASPLNRRIAGLLPDLLDRCQVLHQTGPASANHDCAALERRRQTWADHLRRRYQVVQFVGDELPDLYAAADLVIGRAGAGTVAELAYVGKPAILIPLPGTGGDEQGCNARLLADVGAAVVLGQAEATPDRLRTLIGDLLARPDRLAAMGAAARTVARADASARLADALMALCAGCGAVRHD